jgi:hypothetical protein
MKRMKLMKYISAIIVFLGLSACGEDFLELNPSSALPPDVAIQNVNDVSAVLIGAYSQWQDDDLYGRYLILTPDVMSDDVKQNSQANRSKDWAEYNGNVNDIHAIPTDMWTELYELINRVNTVINTPVEVPSTSQALYNQLLGESYAMRALSHFNLVRVFAQHYGFTADNGHPGVPIVTEFDVNAEPTRNTVAEVYNAVISDLNTAVDLLNDDRGTGFFSRDAALALLARVYLYQSDWNNAMSFADQVINSGNFSLTPTEGYLDAWRDNGTPPDAIFEVINTEVDNIGSDALGRMYIVEGYGDYLPSNDLYNLIDDADVRKQLFKEDPTAPGGIYGNIRVDKYPSAQGDDNIPVIRLAEVYMIRAEARAMTGNEAGAIEDLMMIRRRAWPDAPDVVAAGQALLDEIEKEKRIELMYEGHRLWELMRKKKGVVRNDCTVPPDLNACMIAYPDERFILPIPKEEINANPNIQQNPGY